MRRKKDAMYEEHRYLLVRVGHVVEEDVLNSLALAGRGVADVVAEQRQIEIMRRHHRRDRVLVDELRLAVAAQQQREIVEPGDDSLELDPLDEEHRHRGLVATQSVEKKILKILAFKIGRAHV